MYFWSDPHFWHKRVIESCKRPFTSVEEMNEALIINYNSLVKPSDDCYWLGDMFFCGVMKMKDILVRLNGRKHWVIGNHDFHLNAKRFAEFGCEWMRPSHQLVVDNRKINLCHFPYRGGGDKPEYPEERYHSARLDNDGSLLVHGHVHCAWKTKGNMVNAGVDVWDYKPVHIDQILDSLKA